MDRTGVRIHKGVGGATPPPYPLLPATFRRFGPGWTGPISLQISCSQLSRENQRQQRNSSTFWGNKSPKGHQNANNGSKKEKTKTSKGRTNEKTETNNINKDRANEKPKTESSRI